MIKHKVIMRKGEKERYTHLNAEFQRIARRDEKAFFSNQCKEIEEKNTGYLGLVHWDDPEGLPLSH